MLHEFDLVRVVKLRDPPLQHLRTTDVERPPRLGDTGTILGISRDGDARAFYLVEAVNGDGETIWLGEFTDDELQLLSSHGAG